jgi:hypothetical protein
MRILLCLLFFCVAAHAQGVNVPNLPSINGSVSITTANTYQSVLPALTNGVPPRRSITIQNNNASDSCEIEVTGLVSIGNTTSTNVTTPSGVTLSSAKASILLLAGGSYTRYYPYIPTGPIVGTCASNGDSVYVDTQ